MNKKKYSYCLILCLVFLNNKVFSQSSDKKEALYNIISGTIISGVGAVINKDKNDKISKAFLNGAAQGAIGGYLVFESKRLVRKFNDEKDFFYVFPSRIVNSIGNSIILNGASNNNFGDEWFFNIGFTHIDYKRREKVKVQIMPITFAFVIRGFVVSKLDFKKSLNSGIFIFSDNITKEDRGGFMLGNTITYRIGYDELITYKVIAHELIHFYQAESSISFNRMIGINNNINLNHKNIYFDLNTLSVYPPYLLFKNKFENEAYYYMGINKMN